MSTLFEQLKSKVAPEQKKIVLPESLDERVLRAASKLAEEAVVTPVLIGDEKEITDVAKAHQLDVSRCIITNPKNYAGLEKMVAAFVERRNGKVDEAAAQELLLQEVNYFATMLTFLGEADGLVSGAVHATSDTIRPALQIIKTKDGVKKASSEFIMVRGEEKYIFADCAINIAPDAEDLAEIAIESAQTASLFDMEPRVAMLSFSTKGSAVSEETEKVIEAVKIAKEKAPHLLIDGEFQFDAAFVPSVAAKKAPDSAIQGDANVFVFPSLEAGNISYKITERLGGFEAIGPILLGLNKPVNDLSRGASAEDIYKVAIITALQGMAD